MARSVDRNDEAAEGLLFFRKGLALDAVAAELAVIAEDVQPPAGRVDEQAFRLEGADSREGLLEAGDLLWRLGGLAGPAIEREIRFRVDRTGDDEIGARARRI